MNVICCCGRNVKRSPKRLYWHRCIECDGRGTSYVDHSTRVTHPYHVDHMNAHLCTTCCGMGKTLGKMTKKDVKRLWRRHRRTLRDT